MSWTQSAVSVSPRLALVLALFAWLGSAGGAGAQSTPTVFLQYLVVSDDTVGIGYENEGKVQKPAITVHLSAITGQTVTVQYATSDGTAQALLDYKPRSETLVFAPGELSKTIVIDLVDDVLPEPSEHGFIELSNATNATVDPTGAKGRFLIHDDDGPVPTVDFASSTYTVNEDATSASLVVGLSMAAAHPVTVEWTSAGSGPSPASSPADYTPASGNLTFAPGETSKTIEVAIVNDPTPEASEEATFTLSSATGAALGTQATAVLTIMDDDILPSVQFGASTYSGDESSTFIEVEIKLSSEAASPVTVKYSVIGGTAQENDYQLTPDPVVFAAKTATSPGETSKKIKIGIVDDGEHEFDETLELALDADPAGAVLGAQTDTVVMILDNDVPVPTVQLAQEEYEFLESEGDVGIKVVLSVAPWTMVKVGYRIVPLTAAAEGTDADYSALAEGVVEFLEGQREANIPVLLKDDGTAEEAESFHVLLTTFENAQPGNPMEAEVFIVDDDDPLPVIQFLGERWTLLEGSETDVVIQLRKGAMLTNALLPIKVTVQSFDGTDDIVVGTATVRAATAPEDYLTVNQVAEIKKGDARTTFKLKLRVDNVVEPHEYLTLVLSNPSKGAVLGAQSMLTVLILRNDTGADVEIRAGADQKGLTGDVVESIKGDLGQKHYVSPKKADSYVVLKAQMSDPAKKFEDFYKWDGGEAGDTNDTRKISRKDANKHEVKVLDNNGKVVDQMNVWIVWADIVATGHRAIQIVYEKAPTKGNPKVPEKLVAAISIWTSKATVSPKQLFDLKADIPDLRGAPTQNVPGAADRHPATNERLGGDMRDSEFVGGGADHRWDISRRIQVRISSPTVATADHAAIYVGPIFDGLPSDKQLTTAAYPLNEVVGNDDAAADDEDNRIYLDGRAQPGLLGVVLTSGEIASFDAPFIPGFKSSAGMADGETYEVLADFGEFARLQIGNSNSPAYRNWYTISSFRPWHHYVRLKRVDGLWIDNPDNKSESAVD